MTFPASNRRAETRPQQFDAALSTQSLNQIEVFEDSIGPVSAQRLEHPAPDEDPLVSEWPQTEARAPVRPARDPAKEGSIIGQSQRKGAPHRLGASERRIDLLYRTGGQLAVRIDEEEDVLAGLRSPTIQLSRKTTRFGENLDSLRASDRDRLVSTSPIDDDHARERLRSERAQDRTEALGLVEHGNNRPNGQLLRRSGNNRIGRRLVLVLESSHSAETSPHGTCNGRLIHRSRRVIHGSRQSSPAAHSEFARPNSRCERRA